MSPCTFVTGYQVIHNIPGNDTTIIIIPAPTTTTTIIGATLGSTYTVEIKASNIFGYGSVTSTIITGKYINNCTGGSSMHEV